MRSPLQAVPSITPSPSRSEGWHLQGPCLEGDRPRGSLLAAAIRRNAKKRLPPYLSALRALDLREPDGARRRPAAGGRVLVRDDAEGPDDGRLVRLDVTGLVDDGFALEAFAADRAVELDIAVVPSSLSGSLSYVAKLH
jgi:hypothetical protein